ncbi:MAG TPA: acyl-protein synthetase, partial [Eubacterium sp.]|nr:acyl-protein synthetase [Eubacterium sp.]
MKTFDEIVSVSPYSLDKEQKKELLNNRLIGLTRYHYENCKEYKKMIDCIGTNIDDITEFVDIPFLPVRLFKEMDLYSINKEQIFKT